MEFRVLGPLEIIDSAGRPLTISSSKHRGLLSLLLLENGVAVPSDRIIDQLWGDHPPPSATATLQSYISQLRRLLEPERGPRQPPGLLLTTPTGYRLAAPASSVDLAQFVTLADEAARLLGGGQVAAAEERLETALRLWRGEPLAELQGSQADAERTRLEQIRITAQEQLAQTRIQLGRPDSAVAELEVLVAAHPLRERLWARLIEALYLSGRQADALAAYQRCASLLRDELGIDPGPELVGLEQAVLRQELAPPTVPDDLRPRGGPDGSTPPPREDRPLVGRLRETELIRAVLAQTTRGSGSVLVLEGEAGIGKTRLALEATAMAEAQGWRSAWTRCADDAGAPALWPWSRLLEQLDLGPLDEAPGDDPDQSRFALFEALRSRLQEVATATPLLLVLDDVQAADDSSLRLLTLLGRHLDSSRLLVVATVRTLGEDLSPAVQECLTGLAREPHAQRLQISGLPESSVRELLASTLGEEQGDRFARRIHLRTHGNPFFVGEIARLLQQEPAGLGGADDVPMPPSVRDVLERRLSALPEETLGLLRLAAVAGVETDLPQLQPAGGLEAEALVATLEPAVRAGVLIETQPGWAWRFSHGLVQETLVGGLSRVESARLHHRVALALEGRSGGRAADLAGLAHHFLHAVPVAGVEPAVRYATLAADAARARLAHPEAAQHTRQALRLLEASSDAADRQRHQLLVALATDLLRSGEPSEAQEVVAQALDLGRRIGDRKLLAEAASVWGGVTMWNWRAYGVVDRDLVALLEDLAREAHDEDPALVARLLGTLGVELAYSDRRADGVRHAETAVALARELGDAPLLGRVLNNYSLVSWGSVDGVERRVHAADEAVALSSRGLPARTEYFARLQRGPLRLHLGDADGFEADLAAATRISAGLTGPEIRPHLVYEQAGRAMVLGQWQEAEELAQEAYELYQRTNMWGAEVCWAIHQFTFRRQDGRIAEAIPLLRQVGDQGVPLIQELAVAAAAEAGDREEALRLRARWPQQRPQDWTTDALVVARAWTALALGDDLEEAYAEVHGFSGRQIVVGSATACWGPYDVVLADLASARGDEPSALRHARDALVQARTIRSPWQVRVAEDRLARTFAPG